MSPITRTALLSAVWIIATLAAALLLVNGIVTLSDAALRTAFAALALVTIVASLLLFPAPQPVAPRQESRPATHLRTTSELRAGLR